jgi:cell division protein FtsW
MAGRESARARRAPASTSREGPRRAERHLRLVAPNRRQRNPADAARDQRRTLVLLFVPTCILMVVGLTMILSAGSISAVEGYGTSFWYFDRQLIYAVAGLLAMVVAWRLPHTVWQKLAVPMLVVIVPLMLIALHPSRGTALYGASRWIDLGPVTLQPAEFLKLAVVAFVAMVLANKWHKLDDPLHLLLPIAPVMLVLSFLVILQRDLGTTVVLCGTVMLLLFAAGVRLRYLGWTAAVGLAGAAILIFGEAYRRTRFVDAFLNPWSDPKGSGFQLIQGLIALGSGGWTGVGLGASRQKWDYLPNAHSDFIFAIIGEELGLLGALFVLAMFALLIYAGIRIAVRAPDTFGRLMAAGITAWIGLQTIVNLGSVTGLMPITGVPLPLVSFGGTALVVTLAGIGVLASVARSGARTGQARSGTPAGSARRGGRRT